MTEDITRALALALPTPMPAFRATITADDGSALVLDGSEPSPVVLGSGPASGLRLSADTVSRRHVTVELCDGLVRVIDLGSTNGTRVDGVRVERAFARDGSTLELGALRLGVSLRREVVRPVSIATGFGGFLGVSTETRRLHPLLRRIADSTVPTLLEGETGTGKEIVARAIHEEGPRRAKPFVVVDCTTLPSNLAESELFGHERGAFTGATSRRIGAFEEAEGGTVFLDEIGDLDPAVQAKLLRVIDRGEHRPVGSTKWRTGDVRVLAATRRDLDREVSDRRFRDDLYHRLVVARVVLPPLRERRGDVAYLAGRFCVAEGFSPDVLPVDMLTSWTTRRWPGNVRELRLAVQRFLALGIDPRPSAPSPAGDPFDAVIAEGLSLPDARRRITEEFERRYVAAALARSEGNVSQAARDSGVARRHFQTLKARSTDDDE